MIQLPIKNTRSVEKLNSIDERILLRKNAGHFKKRACRKHVSNPTICCHISKLGFYYLRSGKKGLFSAKELIRKEKFCRKTTLRRLGPEFLRHGISLYLEGMGILHKKIPWIRPHVQQHANGHGTMRDYELVAQIEGTRKVYNKIISWWA